MPAPATADIHLIAACASNRVIGRAGRLPWHIPEDLAWLDTWTRGRTLVLGRICYETWPQVHLHGRRPVVVTSRPHEALLHEKHLQPTNNPLVACCPIEALKLAENLGGPILVCGGARLFEACLPLASRLLLTEIHAEVQGDTRFPEWNPSEWRFLHRHSSYTSEYRFTFSVLERMPRTVDLPGL